ncbi:Fic family protein [Lactococcus nasutitermitis]|uniref:Fic family protein n=1 Tax=Lactococcus nasutitermitis TaxID=1652957 RepID=A0ABV9JDA2_9LACT|nr:Fic family protein [Lactococcus nasutitermitis]
MSLNERLEQLTKKLDEMQSYRPLDMQQLAVLDKSKKFEHIWSSTKLEGGTLEYSETEAILDAGVTLHGVPVKDILETLDLSEAYDYMKALVTGEQAINERVIQQLNRFATLQSMKGEGIPGAYRVVPVRPRGAEFNPYPQPHLIRKQMEDLIFWNEKAQYELHPVQYAAELHQRFVTIHPFLDGNGRTARLLMEFALTRNGYPITIIQPDIQSRIKYMNVLAETQKTGNRTPFTALVADYVDKELDERIEVLKLYEENIKQTEHQKNSTSVNVENNSSKFYEKLASAKKHQEKALNSSDNQETKSNDISPKL